MSGVFITGTDTDIGKTVVAAWLVHHWQAAYWKPIQSGTEDATDPEVIESLVSLTSERLFPTTYTLSKPLSPHASSEIDGIRIDLDCFDLPISSHPLVVEGAGGVLVPLNDQDLVIDLMVKLALPVMVVARSGLGTINHSLLTLSALRERGLDILGVVMVGEKNESNRQAIEKYGAIKVIAEIPILNEISKQSIAALAPPPDLSDLKL